MKKTNITKYLGSYSAGTGGSGGGKGAVESVNGKVGVVNLTGEDINTTVDTSSLTVAEDIKSLKSTKFDASNLVGGNDIEIIPEPVEGGIDEYTLACWHFDNSMYDVVGNLGFSYDRVGSFIPGVFDTGVYSVYGGRTDSSLLCDTHKAEEDFTIECFLLPRSTSASSTMFYMFAGGDSDYYGLGITISIFDGTLSLSHRNAELTNTTFTPLTSTDKPHISFQKRGNFAEVYLNGKNIMKYDISSILIELTGTGFAIKSGNCIGIDELRISKVARYKSDFKVQTKAFSVAEPTGNMVVNFVGDTQTVKNDLDELGDQVSEIESKIPGTTSATNLLVNKRELESITNTKVTGDGVTSIKVLTQADYAALETKDQNTCYIIVG